MVRAGKAPLLIAYLAAVPSTCCPLCSTAGIRCKGTLQGIGGTWGTDAGELPRLGVKRMEGHDDVHKLLTRRSTPVVSLHILSLTPSVAAISEFRCFPSAFRPL